MKNTYKTIQIKDLKGFRKRLNGKIETHKFIDGKRYWETFDKESDAYFWKKNFHPLLNPTPEHRLPKIGGGFNIEEMRKTLSQGNITNGQNQLILFKEVWQAYWDTHLLTKELHTQYNNKKAAHNFYGSLLKLKMCEINRGTISKVIQLKKAEVLSSVNKKAHRYNFDNELKKLSTLFNWYKKNFDQSFENPVCVFHRTEGQLRKQVKKKRKMNAEQIKEFFKAFDKDKNGRFWRDVAETQLYLTARIQEVGGLLWKHVDFKRSEIEICDVAVYLGKKFVALKEGTKNGETRVIKMNKTLYEILQRRFKEKDSSCPFVFHLKGRPLDKDMIDRHYDKAFRASGLRQFSGTHFLRHTMANLLREHLSLDHAKAAGGWRSSRVVELIYTDTPTKLSTESLNCIENLLS